MKIISEILNGKYIIIKTIRFAEFQLNGNDAIKEGVKTLQSLPIR